LFVCLFTMNTSGDSFEPEPSSTGEKDTMVKWSIGNTRYEIYIPVLNCYKLGYIVQHCMLVKRRINQEVGNVVNHYRLYVSVFGTTSWQTILSMQRI
jgi:hypothetical protein